MDRVHESPLPAPDVTEAMSGRNSRAERRSLLKGVAGAAALAAVPTSAAVLSPARFGRIRDAMTRHVELGSVPGVVTLVSLGGEVHADAVGTTAYGAREPMRRDTIFRIASMTKPVTAAAAMILVEEGRLRLDDPVDELLPELANRRVLRKLESPLDDTVAAHRPINLRDLLTFRSGHGFILGEPGTLPIQALQSQLDLAPSAELPKIAPDEWIKRLGRLPLAHQPGEKWMYHTGSDVLGVLIARSTGGSFGKFLHDRIFAPLGMTDTGFHVPAGEVGRLPTSYMTNFETGERQIFDDARASRFARPPVFESGGSGLVSTADDYHAFCRMMLGRGATGDARILSPASVELMSTNQLTADQQAGSFLPEGYGWGFGMAVVTRRNDLYEVPGRFGWDGGYGTSAYTDPVNGLIGIQLTQQLWTSPSPPPVQRDFWTAVYQALEN